MCSIQSMKRKKMSRTTITVIAFISQVAEPNEKAFSCSACFTYIKRLYVHSPHDSKYSMHEFVSFMSYVYGTIHTYHVYNIYRCISYTNSYCMAYDTKFAVKTNWWFGNDMAINVHCSLRCVDFHTLHMAAKGEYYGFASHQAVSIRM